MVLLSSIDVHFHSFVSSRKLDDCYFSIALRSTFRASRTILEKEEKEVDQRPPSTSVLRAFGGLLAILTVNYLIDRH